jgi:hypothetical protein
MGSAPPGRQGIAAAVLATARSLGMVLGIGIAGAILTTMMARDPGANPDAGMYEALRLAFQIAAAITAVGVLTSWGRRGSTADNPPDRTAFP